MVAGHSACDLVCLKRLSDGSQRESTQLAYHFGLTCLCSGQKLVSARESGQLVLESPGVMGVSADLSVQQCSSVVQKCTAIARHCVERLTPLMAEAQATRRSIDGILGCNPVSYS